METPSSSDEECFVCQMCGDKGFTNAFVYCVNCLDIAIHRYCLNVMPKTSSEHVFWYCEYCKSTSPNQVVSSKKKQMIPTTRSLKKVVVYSAEEQTDYSQTVVDPVWRDYGLAVPDNSDRCVLSKDPSNEEVDIKEGLTRMESLDAGSPQNPLSNKDKPSSDLNSNDDSLSPPNSISRMIILSQEYSKITKNDELQDPSNGESENSILSKSKKKVCGRKKYKTGKKSTKVDTIRTRQSPQQLVKVLSKLTSEQKKDLREMGFESLIDFRIHTIPSKLAYWVVDNFDAERCKMMIGDKVKVITRECVHEILGFPMGSIEVNAVSRAGIGNKSVISEWRKQYPKPSKGTRRILFKDVLENVKNEKEGGRLFKLNILVLIMTNMAEGIKCATVNEKFLPCIQNENEILNMDWCGYVLECLKRSKIRWRRDDTVCWYTGPLLFLVVWYVHNSRCKSNDMDIVRPAILYWSSESLKNRERDLLHSQGSARLEVRTEEKPELVHVLRAAPIDKTSTSINKEGSSVRLMSKKRTRREMESASEIYVYSDKTRSGSNSDDDLVSPTNSISQKKGNTLCQEYRKITKNDELQDPSNGESENSIFSKSKKKVRGRKKYKTGKKSTKVDTIRTRQSPQQLVKVLSKLTSEQKKDLREMGFESLIDFRIHTIPSKLAYWVVDNFDAERCKMMIGNEVKVITRECVHEILGFPMGSIEVNAVSRAGIGNKSVISEWRKQYPKPSKGTRRILFKDVLENVKNEKEGGRLFKLNILVLIMTNMAEGIKCATVNEKFLPCIQNENEIRNMDWCGYVLECLKRSKISWRRDDAVCWYTGPLLFLVVWYVHNSRCKSNDMDIVRPAILYWSSESLKNRERDLLHSQGSARLKVRTEEKPELVHVLGASPIDKTSTSINKEGRSVILMSRKRTQRQLDSASEITVRSVDDDERIVSMHCEPVGERTKASADERTGDSNSDDDFVWTPNSISRKKGKTLGQDYSNIAKYNELQDPTNEVTENSILSKSKKKVHVTIIKSRNTPKVDTIFTRQSPIQLVKVLSKLTGEQKQVLREMGLESLIDFRIHTIPGKLAYWVVDNFDAERCKMMIDDKAKEITRMCVHEILGFQMGSIEVNAVSRAETSNRSVLSDWREQYPKPSKGPRRVFFKDIMENVINEKEVGRLFKLNILVLIMTIMADGIKNATVNRRFLTRIQNEDEIRNMDWCGYVLKCLKRSKISWRRDDAVCWYTGPLLFLAVWYMHNTRCKSNDMDIASPTILYWSSEALKNREREELLSGGFGKLKVRTKEKPDLVHGPKSTPVDKINTSINKEGNLVSNKCTSVSNSECGDKEDEIDTESHIVEDGNSNKGLESDDDDVVDTETYNNAVFEDATEEKVCNCTTKYSTDELRIVPGSNGKNICTEEMSMEYNAKEYANEIRSIYKKLCNTRLDLEDKMKKAAIECPNDEDLCEVIQWVRGDLQKSDKEKSPIDVSENDDNPKVNY